MTDSPDFLGAQPGHGAGVQRVNRLPLIIAGLLLLAIIGAITYTYQMRLAATRADAARNVAQPSGATPADVFKDAPDGGLIPAKTAEPAAPPPAEKEERPALHEQLPDREALARERRRQALERLRASREAAASQALTAPTAVRHAAPETRGGERDVKLGASPPPTATGQLTASYAEALQRRALAAEGKTDDINRASEKAAWLNNRSPQKADTHYLPEGRVPAKSPYELKAGTVIPAIMIGGINSDLPGQILGQVRENVYDSATGRYILIPQGSKLVGTYDNAVTTGQERVLVAWTRIIFPDASSVDLGKMPGADSAGFAGLHDQVDTHFWKSFGNALLMSVFTAGVQLSQGTSGDTNGTSASETITASLGQQLSQLGQEIARRNTQVQPTLEIRPGMHFTVIATKDVVISPWRTRRAGAGQ